MEPVTTQTLQEFSILKDVPENQLQWLIDQCEQESRPEGDFIYKPDVPLRGIHFVLKGTIEFYRLQNGNKQVIAEIGSRQVTGILPFSRANLSLGFTICKTDVDMLVLPKPLIKTMIERHYELTQVLVMAMINRVRELTAQAQQNEKMMALGKLAAGLAHELNNPAAAIVRGSSTLKEHLQLFPETFKKLISATMTEEQVDLVSNKMTDAIHRQRQHLGLLERSAWEDDVSDWLDDHKIDDPCDIPVNFADFGLTTKDLDELAKQVPAEYLETVLIWINNNLTTERMVTDIQEASARISELVKSVKIFTHMDGGADKQYIDIHTGIRNTLVMMQHKIRKGKITIVEEFDETLPKVHALAGELNQVWTNLIDNSIDALEGNGEGTITLRTEKDHEFVKVTVTDNGPGIPPEHINRVFDPFFTTKEIGKGTGLGLDVVMMIIKQHHGTVKATSEPGRTVFTICFPING
ncbi:ATP-binding protein [Chitinophaga sp. GCM10012297]|uniref:histidine kinase n=1 Tax=Chitinophaga chungangae TaxID=2821488 RepID=A0ABS3YH85_9BACT|nr:ATP-binding protein [Chitinophaga chungangae]MBO9154041.1 cyclic nucleotide-binding domain-containing protein [Chitinophaga chungangae]